MNQSKGDSKGNNFKPQEQCKDPQDVICPYCGRKFEAANPESFPLPKHKNPSNGQDFIKVAWCVGEGKRGKTLAAIKQEKAARKKEERRQRDRERKQQLRSL